MAQNQDVSFLPSIMNSLYGHHYHPALASLRKKGEKGRSIVLQVSKGYPETLVGCSGNQMTRFDENLRKKSNGRLDEAKLK